MFVKSTKSVCLIQKEGLKLLIETADVERVKEFVIRNKPIEYSVEFYFQKPLKGCSLEEVIGGLIVLAREGNWHETVDYTGNNDHYTLMITHSLGLNNSKINVMMFENMFKNYRVKIAVKGTEKTCEKNVENDIFPTKSRN